MAEITTTRSLPAEYIEALGKTYAQDLTSAVGGLKGLDVSKMYGPQFVAGQSALQTQAQQLGQQGLGSYQPYVINTTLRQYDVQAQKNLPGLAAQAIGAGAYGGGREGVQRAEYQSQSDLNRALLQAQLQQQGYSQAQQLAGQQYNQQLGLAGQTQGLLGSQIAGLSALGQTEQAQRQAELEAQKQLEFQRIYQPLQTAQQYGQGVMGLISGYPQQTQLQSTPSPSPLQTLLGTGATLAGIYRALGQGSAGFATK